MTSHDVVQRVRRIYGTRAVGHTGTLDPFATGLLVALVGRATRLARFVEGQAKTYLAEARVGFATDTDDATGAALGPDIAVELAEDTVRTALERFRGPQRQRPPAYSAKHVAGERSYHRARRGELVELDPVPVEVVAIELVTLSGNSIRFRATVSAGTYIRAIARDLGRELGAGAHLTALRRERIGQLSVADAVSLERLGPGTALLPPEAALPGMARLELDVASAQSVHHGRTVAGPAGAVGQIALMHGGALVAVGEAAEGMVRPRVVLDGA
jgi:tRNA pseudouridine55 synthase